MKTVSILNVDNMFCSKCNLNIITCCIDKNICLCKNCCLDNNKKELVRIKKLQQKKVYYQKNKSLIKEKKATIRALNREMLAEKARQYYADNKEEILFRSKLHYRKNKFVILSRDKEYYEKNKEKIIKKAAIYYKARRGKDINFKIKANISRSICAALFRQNASKKGITCLKYLQYTIKELKQHLENQFESWMSWDNYGMYKIKTWDDNDKSTWTWQIDHIIPQSYLPYDSMEHPNFQKCWALENLRPYSAKQNIIDGNRR